MANPHHLTASRHAALPDAAGDVPDWVHLVPAGRFSGEDGRGPYILPNPAGIITTSMAGGPLVVDEAHATDHGLKTGIAAPAQGWIVEMQARADGLWGRVEWTDLGRAALADRHYRGLSPVFTHRKDGQVLQVLRAALTNAPNLALAALNSATGNSMDLMTRLRQALGLAEDIDEAGVITALEAKMKPAAALCARIAGQLGLPADAAEDAVVVALQARVAAGGEADTLRQTMVGMQGQLTTLRTDAARDKATAAVDGAIRAGKPIPKTLRDHYIARHMQDPASVDKELGSFPSLHAGGMPAREAAPDGGPDGEPDAVTIALQAQELEDKERAAGRSISFAEAVQRISTTARAA